MTVPPLSELEGICLGLVRKFEPCTAYRVRQELKAAPSSHWRASAGSVYPLLTRLEDRRLVTQSPDAADGRGRKLLRITPQGQAALRKWLLMGAGPDLIASTTDPVRSRMFFLDVLSATQQTAYLDELVAAMVDYLGETRAYLATLPEDDDPCAYLGALGAVRIAEARLKWLQDVTAKTREHTRSTAKDRLGRRLRGV